eukprot:5397725-Alexandrium_andersonii.AAC.1
MGLPPGSLPPGPPASALVCAVCACVFRLGRLQTRALVDGAPSGRSPASASCKRPGAPGALADAGA